MRSVSSPPTVGSTTISNSVVITSMPTTIARLAMPPSARGTMWPKLRLQPDSGAAGFSHRASATGNLTMPIRMPSTRAAPDARPARRNKSGVDRGPPGHTAVRGGPFRGRRPCECGSGPSRTSFRPGTGNDPKPSLLRESLRRVPGRGCPYSFEQFFHRGTLLDRINGYDEFFVARQHKLQIGDANIDQPFPDPFDDCLHDPACYFKVCNKS